MESFSGSLDEVFLETEKSAESLAAEDLLVNLSAMLEPDGGMPGQSAEMRIAHSLAALLFFYQHNNTHLSGTFRRHVERLLSFLGTERTKQLNKKQQSATFRILEWLKTGRAVHGPWEQFVRTLVQSSRLESSEFWATLDAAATKEEFLATPENANGS
jgi:hypothetical protein